ncbi:MAG: MazG family protein [Anaerolineae bacterium]|nr:MazG family protein [Anaerolineae bacterium]
MITIIGLGPGDPELITRRGWQRLTAAPAVWVRTRRHPAVPALAAHTVVHSYDHLYEQHEDFAAVYQAIALDVVMRGTNQDVVYAVPGDPTVAETTTHLIRRLAAERGLTVVVEPGVSFLEPTFAALDIDPIAGLQIVDAMTLAAAHHPPGSPNQGLIVAQLYSRLLAGDVKLTLMNAYPDDHPVTLVTGAGTADLRLRPMLLYELDRGEVFDDHTSLWVPPLARPAGYEALQEVIAHLRSPEGCPWDRAQTHRSLRPYLLEETYEVLEALDNEDETALAEELGDLLIQAALHIQIATEEGAFKLPDVIGHVVEKLIRRHPHVFGTVQVADAGEVVRNWEAIKQEERRSAAATGRETRQTLLDGIPTALPALTLAQSYIERLTRVGYPLPPAAPMDEEDLGMRLLGLVEQAQVNGLEAEAALRRVCRRLRERLTADGRWPMDDGR